MSDTSGSLIAFSRLEACKLFVPFLMSDDVVPAVAWDRMLLEINGLDILAVVLVARYPQDGEHIGVAVDIDSKRVEKRGSDRRASQQRRYMLAKWSLREIEERGGT